MARDVYVTSDTHFGHANIIKYCDRPFDSVDEMNEVLIENWNKVVKPGDIIYHLGDVFMGMPKEKFPPLWKRLNGRKRLIIGNHDDVPYLVQGAFFQKVMLWRVWNDRPIIFTHVPIHPDSIHERVVEKGGINVHGHTHNHGSPEGPYKCICTELTNYTPVHLEELI